MSGGLSDAELDKILDESLDVELPLKKKRGRKRKVKAAPKPAKVDELAGLSVYDCCAGCRVDRCVITEAPFCAHPFKSPLQSFFLSNQDVVRRYNKARARLDGQKVDAGRF